MRKGLTFAIIAAVAFGVVCFCDLSIGPPNAAASAGRPNRSDALQQAQQETILQEATAQTGMPAITNFRERKLLKQIIEMRDQEGLLTYTYVFSEMTGKFTFVGRSIGYGIPYSTQYTNPERIASYAQGGFAILPQADPNALFSPGSAEGTWIMLIDEETGKPAPVHMEPRVVVSPFRLPQRLLQ